ncbi:MAG: hypothetical protein WD830_11790 [Chloroflexota bacterium]
MTLAPHQLTARDRAGGRSGGLEDKSEQSVTVDGVLVVTLELERRPSRYEPLDHIWLFQSSDSWTLLTLRRTERWTDGGAQAPVGGTATVQVEEVGCVDALADRIRRHYGESGWTGVLDAGHINSDELFRQWVPVQVERDLDRAVFFRPDLVAIGGLSSRQLAEVRGDVEQQLGTAGFAVVEVGPPRRPTRPGENLVLAEAIVRRYSHEIITVIRVDSAGEIYPRLADPDDVTGAIIRQRADDDE